MEQPTPPSAESTPSRPTPHSVPSDPNILPSNQAAVATGASVAPSQQKPLETAAATGPLRHPRPITAAELHNQLEREQEAVVNRLTRELSMLRASHNASTVSNASSTPSFVQEVPPPAAADSHLLPGSNYMMPSRRHQRSSSNASSRSTTAAVAGSVSSTPIPPSTRPNLPFPPSRQGSTTSMRQSITSAPGSTSSSFIDPSFAYFQQQRQPFAGPQPGSSVYATPGGSGTHGLSTPMGDGSGSPSFLPATLRMEETAFYKSELDSARRENELLRNKIRELERMVRQRRESDVSRARSGSVASTSVRSVAGSSQPPLPSTVSTSGGGVVPSPGLSHSNIATPRDKEKERVLASTPSVAGSVGIGVPEDEVKVGESASSAWPDTKPSPSASPAP
jgi:hypothetical protein